MCSGHYQQWARGEQLRPLRRVIKSLTRDQDGRKHCSQCLAWKPVSDFYPSNKGNRDGLSSYCVRCDRNMIMKNRYGITLDEYENRLAYQNGSCAICLRPPKAAALHVDHDHSCCPQRKRSCGKCIRGLLCEDCNRALGMFDDDIQRLKRAMEYLSNA